MFIGLLSTLVIVGGLFFALKPPGKGADSKSPYNGPIASAQQAVALSQSAASRVENATGSTSPTATATPATHVAVQAPAGAKPAIVHAVVHHPAPAAVSGLAPGDHSAKILTAVAHHHVAVVLFWKHGGADDDAVRRAVAQVSRQRGVDAFSIPISKVGEYPAITTGVDIEVTPTTLVIGPDHRFQELTGFTDAPSLATAVWRARH
jgi:hypothetical protein